MPERSNEFYTQYQHILPPNALGYRLKLLSQSIDRQFQDILDPFGLTPLQWGILCCLWQQDGLPTLQISKQLQQLSGNLAVALPLMEKQGYIRRQCDEKDRRIFRVWLTSKGKQLKQVLPAQASELDRKLFESLSVDERASFAEIVDRLRRDYENRQKSTTKKIDQT
ncbi:MarR family transcriptional regulator [Aetokthonos hydrillicola Thurmond2011]|jgi:DNA-binding MarR family transcriptional regulator|uniref:MarR family transcriptional regulator n=1 Tax=Aetokthonos hydrillicola Thurmond2011 TaxID=2712845 RepID=A0AAP5IFH6_9CYAN|nr:MarR family transcriptional regulator [Aetokthonos hydrillicola]MBO3460333.1 MarR family transcriptional regulator [Aetokthonos hydrillicola CCALA 1050]MBW4590787.1 MarR family transcriptional regulator [Aetokthonos hydrillicola CCALA 1050]MDR9898050.1 MarR family transcriptional regulator [Aetokthonos hydrillicola Thurmond2011]